MPSANRHQRRKNARQRRRAGNEQQSGRQALISAFSDWVVTVPEQPPFWTQPGFAPFSDLDDAELNAASEEIQRRTVGIRLVASGVNTLRQFLSGQVN